MTDTANNDDDRTSAQERAAARASDIEQRESGRTESEDERTTDGASRPILPQAVGSSGYIPRADTALPAEQHGDSGSPGAEQDREAAQRSQGG
jgi:hypothetical protein